MSDSAATIDRLQTFQVALHIASQVTFDLHLIVRDRVDDLIQLLRGQIFRAQIGIDIGLLKNSFGSGKADSVDIRQGSFDALFCWNFDS
jgi:hypothetical protein